MSGRMSSGSAPRPAGVAVTTAGHRPAKDIRSVPSAPCPGAPEMWDSDGWPACSERTCPLIPWHWLPGIRRGSYLMEAQRPVCEHVTRVTPACGAAAAGETAATGQQAATGVV